MSPTETLAQSPVGRIGNHQNAGWVASQDAAPTLCRAMRQPVTQYGLMASNRHEYSPAQNTIPRTGSIALRSPGTSKYITKALSNDLRFQCCLQWKKPAIMTMAGNDYQYQLLRTPPTDVMREWLRPNQHRHRQSMVQTRQAPPNFIKIMAMPA